MKKTTKVLFLLLLFICLSVNSYLYASKKQEPSFIDGKDFVSVSSDKKLFSPNNDSFSDTVTFEISLLQEKMKIKNWRFDILNIQTDKIVYSFSGQEEIPKTLIWDGKDQNGNFVEGNFKYIFTALINKKNIKIEQADEIVSDITEPYISLSSSADTVLLDKENNKFVKDVVFNFDIGDESEIDKTKTKLQVYSFKNKVVKEWDFSTFSEIPQTVSWDGKDDIYGLLVPAGEYKVVLTVSDIINNKTSINVNITTFEQVVGKVSEIVVKEEPRGLVVNLSSNILFSSGNSILKKEAKSSLDETVKLLNAYPANKVLIEGYTDSTGDKEKNLKLSYDRAQAVYLYFVQNEVPAERLSVVGYGQDNPVASNKTAKGRAQNRRVNIIILKSQSEDTSDSGNETNNFDARETDEELKNIGVNED
ncbi:OmpA family protein [Candidatus Ruminimicrobiellum ovillum]|uniref:OmpA family protein n=1 Tax=Candidatus Ruminimicrobiellum ovillum TaxID=1947927 RepID=UPI0035599F58